MVNATPIGQQWNPFSGDYWNSGGQAARQADVNNSGGQIWAPAMMMGAALKGAGVPVDNLFGPAYGSNSPSSQSQQSNSSGSPQPASSVSPWQTNQFVNGQSAVPDQSQQQAFDPRPQFMQSIMQPFQFDRNAVDTSMFDKMLANQQAQIENTRNLAQNNYNISNKNVGDMYNAFQQHLLDQMPSVQQRYAQANQTDNNIFNGATQRNDDWLNNYNAQKAEMLQRLGIQAAGNAPDLVGQAVAQGNNALNESNTSRQALNDANSQTQQNYFQGMNAMAGNEGLQRQQDLAKSLASINTNLNNQYLQDQSQSDQNKMNFIGQMYQNAFNNYTNERDFNEKALENYNTLMLQQPKYEAQTALAKARTLAAQAQMQKNGGANGSQGIIGLNNAFNPNVSSAFEKLVGNNQDPSQIPAFYSSFMQQRQNDPSLQQVDPSAFFQYLNSYNNMKKVSGFPDMNISVDATQ